VGHRAGRPGLDLELTVFGRGGPHPNTVNPLAVFLDELAALVFVDEPGPIARQLINDFSLVFFSFGATDLGKKSA
jgi:hypothetical protein